MFVDTHCHLDDEKFSDVSEVIQKMRAEKVKIAIDMGCDFKSSKRAESLSELYSEVYFAAGVHPENVTEDYKKELKKIEKLLSEKRCVAVGEIGLDYHYEPFNRELQKEVFALQLELANAYDLPVSIHSRDATEDTLRILKDNKNKLKHSGVMHCFSGSVETAKELLKLGFYFGFGGTVTFKNSVKAVECAEFLPADAILTETDSPYLAPVPKRGSLNEPTNIPLILKKLSEIKGIDEEVLKNRVYLNTLDLFYKIEK